MANPTATVQVLTPGPLTLVEDLGRPGLAASGIGASGAADQDSHRLANRLVGNPESAATLEVLLGGLRLRFDAPAWAAVAGARVPIVVTDRAGHRSAYGIDTRFPIPAGGELELGTATSGLRSYLAVHGGIDVPPVLGSRSTDTLAGLGPDPLTEGMVLPIGAGTVEVPDTDFAPTPDVSDRTVTLHVLPGPHADWLAPQADLLGTTWSVTDRVSRVGARITAVDGPGLPLTDPDRQLPSEGAALGAIQVPPGGEPVLFLADHPVTGGYPVVAVLCPADLPKAAQLRPGTRVFFSTAP